ncbi:hypothetical protein POTOM_032812 [Populus tomentosa]|uniref:Photosystem II 5 kDa protein n=1 Tax=Populus tomentosa TaxID=118781 RepID=A0A8X8CQR4_POPTO|nr:hypothetical protein POTOM_032812 [Populus tomentosa]
MASMTMTASFLTGSAMAKQPSTTPRRGLIVAKASRATEGVNVEMKNREESSGGRRDLMFAAAAAAACSIARVAIADEEPRRGTPEAKKKYAPICVTMPTALKCWSWLAASTLADRTARVFLEFRHGTRLLWLLSSME